MPRAATEDDFDDQGDLTFPMTLGKPGNHDDLIGDDEEDDDDTDPMVTALQEQIEAMSANSDKDRDFFQTQLSTVIARTGQPQQQQSDTPDPTELNLDDLPDPVEKRAEFNTELAKRVGSVIKASNLATATAVSTQAQDNNNISDLNTRFTSNHAELAKKPALFDSVLRQEIAKVTRKGMNAKDFVFADPDKFLNTVAAKMREELGIEDEDLDDLDEENPRKRAPKKSAARRSTRTRGVSNRSTPRSKGKGRSKGKVLGFVDQLKKQQADMGLV